MSKHPKSKHHTGEAVVSGSTKPSVSNVDAEDIMEALRGQKPSPGEEMAERQHVKPKSASAHPVAY
ncbi:MAG: hypothetical protein ACXVGB_00290 [Mycobacteriaceae bacterium]